MLVIYFAASGPVSALSFENNDCRYFKLPYIGKMSAVTQTKIKDLITKTTEINKKAIIVLEKERK